MGFAVMGCMLLEEPLPHIEQYVCQAAELWPRFTGDSELCCTQQQG